MAVLADSNPHALISEVTSYYCFNVEIHSEFPRCITISMCEIVEGVVRHRDFVAKLKLQNYFLGVDLRKFMLTKFLAIR